MPAPTDPASAARRVADDWREGFLPTGEDLDALLPVLDAVACRAEGDRVRAMAEAICDADRYNIESWEVYVPHAHAAIALADAEAAELRAAALCVRDTFKRDMEQGYETKDKRFAVDALSAALDAAVRGMR